MTQSHDYTYKYTYKIYTSYKMFELTEVKKAYNNVNKLFLKLPSTLKEEQLTLLHLICNGNVDS